MATRIINGLLTGDRPEIAARTNTKLATVNYWCSQRDTTGFPLPEGARQDRREWFDLAKVNAWHAKHLAAKQELLTSVDRTGDPNDLLGSRQAAEVLGYRGRSNLPDALLDLADETTTLPSGRVRRQWRRATIWAFADSRTGREGGGRPAGHRPAPRRVDRSGDPDELVSASEAARLLGYSSHQALPKDLYALADETETKPSGRTWHRWQRRTLWTYARSRDI